MIEEQTISSRSNVSSADCVILVEQFQSGDIDAFDEIVDKYNRYVYSLAYRFTRNYEDAYDISQEVFIKVFKSLGNLRSRSTFQTWLRKLTINTCIDYLRQQSKKCIADDLNSLEFIPDANAELPNCSVEGSELSNIILNAVAQLPKRQKKVFILRHYEGLSLKEVAGTLSCPLGTVKANLFHAKRRLKELLLPYVS